MIKLMLEKFLKEHDNWEELLSKSPYNLTIRHGGDLVLFQYNQYTSDMAQRICQEARGIIFDTTTLEPICVPYFKFFNYGELNAAKIDWKTAYAVEKVDGSLIKLYNWRGRWYVATNGMINAFMAIAGKDENSHAPTFGSLFVDALGGIDALAELRAKLDENYCYMFELVHPLTKVVLDYPEPCVYFHGARNMRTLEEVKPFSLPHCKLPKEYGMMKPEKVAELVKELNDGKHEGVVVCDASFNRVKIKTETYLEMAKVANMGPLTPLRFAVMYHNDTLDDYIGFAPQNSNQVRKYADVILNVEKTLESYRDLVNSSAPANKYTRKQVVECAKFFANKLVSIPVAFNFYMAWYDNKVKTPIDYFSLMAPSNLAKLIRRNCNG